MKLMFGTISFAALLSPALAAAQTNAPAPLASERRLSPEQVEAIIEEAAAKRLAEERRVSEPPTPADTLVSDDPDVSYLAPFRGQFGVSVGTGGYREVFGTGIYPLGDGVAAVTLDFVDWGDRRPRY